MGRSRSRPLRRLAILGTITWAVLLASAFTFSTDDRADFATRQTARVAVLYWAIAVGSMLAFASPTQTSRWFWSLGAMAFAVHVATAFATIHLWSHESAFAHVESVSGFGPGIFVSYAFTAIWMADAGWWWIDPSSYEARPRRWTIALHSFMAFIIFNGTVVYEVGWVRWASALVFGVLGVLLALRSARLRGIDRYQG